jgi:hypothetical protein
MANNTAYYGPSSKDNEKKVLFDLSDERNFVAKQKEKCEKFLF